MRALITGASSGIGRDMARYMSKLGYDLVIVARDEQALKELQQELTTNVEVIALDLSQKDNCYKLYDMAKDIDILVNNAGFGLFGKFVETDLEKEISMIQTNITAVHILTKLYLKDMVKNNKGHILNVASIAGFMPGPLMATYYASKNYVVSFTRAINKELRKSKSKVKVSILCPGPVKTNFNNVANVKFRIKGLPSEFVAKYAVDKMLRGRLVIVPGILIKLTRLAAKIIPTFIIEEISYHVQVAKKK